MNLDDALARLPHGPEFRFVDALTSLDPGRSAEATWLIRGDESFLAGHFPGRPLMPGVLLIEALAQLGGIVAQSDPRIAPMDDLRLTAVRQAKITGSAAPGESLVIRAVLTGRMGGLVQVEGTVATGSRQILCARVTLSGTESAGEFREPY